MLKVIARQHIRPGKMDEYLEAIRDLVDATRREPGCIEYSVYVDRARNLGVFIETWESAEHLVVHGGVLAASPHLQKIAPFMDPDATRYPVEIYEKRY